MIIRKSAQVTNKSDKVTVIEDETSEEIDLVLWLWNSFISWAFEVETQDAEKESETEVVDDKSVTDNDNNDEEESLNYSFWESHEEQHLEYFYIVSFVFLVFLIVIIVKQNIESSRKKAILLQKLQKLEHNDNIDLANSGIMRQISFH